MASNYEWWSDSCDTISWPEMGYLYSGPIWAQKEVFVDFPIQSVFFASAVNSINKFGLITETLFPAWLTSGLFRVIVGPLNGLFSIVLEFVYRFV